MTIRFHSMVNDGTSDNDHRVNLNSRTDQNEGLFSIE